MTGGSRPRLVVSHRVNDRFMTTVGVEHNLGGDSVLEILASYADSYSGLPLIPDVWSTPYGLGKDLSRTQVADIVRTAIFNFGSRAYMGEDGFDCNLNPPQALAVAEWAFDQISRLYPRLVDEHLHALMRRFRDAAKRHAEERERRAAAEDEYEVEGDIVGEVAARLWGQLGNEG